MSNVAGKAYGMNVLTPMWPWMTWVNRLLFMAARVFPTGLVGLLGLSFIHFARWTIITRDQWPKLDPEIAPQKLANDYMLFCSNFNGTWDQYIDAFSDGIPGGLDLFWYSTTNYTHSIPITPFKNFIRLNQVDTNYYYNSVPGVAQWDVKAALRLRQALIELAETHAKSSPAEFQKAYVAKLIAVQNDLGSPGYAPVASNDTKNADANRRAYLQAGGALKDTRL